jgi:O-antigen/teichoic acid export membrane protein
VAPTQHRKPVQTLLRWQEYLRGGLRSQTFGNTLWFGSSTIVNGIIGALTSAILARHLGIADFGIYTLVISLLTMLTDVSDLGMSSSIVRFGSESVAAGNRDRLRHVVAIVARWKVLFGVAVILVAWVLLQQIVGYVFHHVDDRIAGYFRLSLVAVALGIVSSIFTPIYQSFKQFQSLSLLFSSRYFVKLLLIVLCVYVLGRYNVELLVWIEILTLALLLGAMFHFSPFKEFSLTISDRSLQRQMFSFNKWISLYQAITLIGGRLDVAFVGGLSDATALGLYGAASKVAAVISAVAGSYMSVLLSEMSASVSDQTLQRKYRHSILMVIAIVAGIALLAALAQPVVVLLFGSGFASAASVLQIMCIGLVFTVLSYPLNASFFARNKSAVFPVVSVISMGAFIVANIYLVPLHAAHGAAMAFALSGAVAFSISLAFFLRGRMETKHNGS